MATPVAAGAAALVRQYYNDPNFWATACAYTAAQYSTLYSTLYNTQDSTQDTAQESAMRSQSFLRSERLSHSCVVSQSVNQSAS